MRVLIQQKAQNRSLKIPTSPGSSQEHFQNIQDCYCIRVWSALECACFGSNVSKLTANFRLSSFCHKRARKRHRANDRDSHPRRLLCYETWDCHSHKGRKNISHTLKRLKDKFSANSAGFSWPIAKWSSTSAKRQCFPCCHSISPSFDGITEACQCLQVTASSVLNPCLGKVWIYAVKPKTETGIASGNCLLQRMQKGWGWRRFSVPQAAPTWTKRYFK